MKFNKYDDSEYEELKKKYEFVLENEELEEDEEKSLEGNENANCNQKHCSFNIDVDNSNDDNDSVDNSKNTDNSSADNRLLKEENTTSSKIVLPKQFEKYKQDIAEFEKALNSLNDKNFIKLALKKAFLEKIEEIAEKKGEEFAKQTIQKIKNQNANVFNNIKENRLLNEINSINLENLECFEIDFDELKKNIPFDINGIYKMYAEIFKENSNLKEFFETFKIDFYVEDIFIL